ncbi:MAG: spermidine synthase [Actinomycetes bacterium]
MSRRFEELAWHDTPIGEISLRRRTEPTLGVDVYEIKLGDEWLMSSLFTAAETELAHLALGRLTGERLDVVVGGLGLGFTARAALCDERVRSLVVVEAVPEVIQWHRDHLLPGAEELVDDPRTELVHGDFFATAGGEGPWRPGGDARPVDAVLVDIDHTPGHVLHPSHAAFYTEDGLAALRRRLHPDGVFGLWSDAPPDPGFLTLLRNVFGGADGHVVTFPNHYTGSTSSGTVYVAATPSDR